MYISVLVELRTKKIDKTFVYKVSGDVSIGSRVLVPFGRQTLEGFVLSKSSIQPDFNVKEIIKVIDEEPVLNAELLSLGKYMSKITLSNLITCYQTMLPSALKAKSGYSVNKLYIKYIKLINKDYKGKNEIQKDLISKLKIEDMILKKDINCSSIKTLIKNGVVEEVLVESYRLKNIDIKMKNNIELTKEQASIVDKVSNNLGYNSFLLRGVTGSGKTEVYMHIIENVLNNGKEAIVLVPEISLTPQLVNIFKKRFGSKVAVLHSGLNSGEKYDEWRKILRKEVSIVIGARSAIFAPFTSLGIIIIDEEHSLSYKQENNPKYSTIDMAQYRAKYNNIPVLLASATPTLESYTKAIMGKYALLELKNRINNNFPKTYLVDMKKEVRLGNFEFSSILQEKIKEKLEKKEQIMLFINRRGYSTISRCPSCGYVHKCSACDIPFTYHLSTNKMKCHYCNREEYVKKICPVCGNKDMNNYGLGTEKVEQLIKEMYPKARVLRMDNDTTRRKGAHELIINKFRNKEADILIGTQMITKGLDFENVTLVGVLNADKSLNMPDFRSSERTFDLISQVSGRSGRAKLLGDVVIQGFNIDHYSIVSASNNDYISFYNEEMSIRKKLKYSPYYNMCKITIKNKDFALCNKEALKIKNYLVSKRLSDVVILGPSSNMIPKINNIYLLHIIIKYKRTDVLLKELEYVNDLYRLSKVNVEIVLNPNIV